MRYLPVTVYSSAGMDCTAGGVTATKPQMLVVPHPEGQYDAEHVRQHGMVILESIAPAFNGCPPRLKPEGLGQSMFGGNYVTGDSRFSEMYSTQPVAVHDRVER